DPALGDRRAALQASRALEHRLHLRARWFRGIERHLERSRLAATPVGHGERARPARRAGGFRDEPLRLRGARFGFAEPREIAARRRDTPLDPRDAAVDRAQRLRAPVLAPCGRQSAQKLGPAGLVVRALGLVGELALAALAHADTQDLDPDDAR